MIKVESSPGPVFETEAGQSSGFPWHSQSQDTLLTLLAATPRGLSSDEARRRLAIAGRNEVRKAARTQPWRILIRQFNRPLAWILVAIGVIAGVFGDWPGCGALVALLLLNAGVGFHQELRAERSITTLRKTTAPVARVRRDGRDSVIPAAEVVPGDLLLLEAGDVVAADARLIEAVDLQCVETPLTGESTPVPKQPGILPEATPLANRENQAFMGTHVSHGTARTLVVATGMGTEIGRFAGLLDSAGRE